jgi:hypothetical protein
MNNDDEFARKAWAEALRKKIAQLTNSEQGEEGADSEHEADAESASNASTAESPRQFVERRMSELDNERTDR